MKRLTCCVAMALALTTGCTAAKRLTDPVRHGTGRSRQLMVLAAVEARHIPNADVRLTRQLNISNEILESYGKDGAIESLREVTQTLNTVGSQLTGHALLAGWVSVAQLSRRASDLPVAAEASRRAVKELEALPSRAERCDYVIGVAEEVNHVQGAPAAAALLMKSGDWATAIEPAETRRSARLAFASALFNLEDYEAGAGVLRQENDPLWSSDAMMRLASPGAYYAVVRNERPAVAAQNYNFDADAVVEPAMEVTATKNAPPAEQAAPAMPAQKYGKALGYESVFEGRTASTASQQ